MPQRYFIDPHCHFFNLDDVPLLSTLKAQIPVNSLLALGLSIRPLAISAIDSQKNFIQFFERPRESNLKKYASLLKESAHREGYDQVLMTPLMMDFSQINETSEENADQTSKLLQAINDVAGSLDNITICPVYGLDLRHIYGCGNADALRDKVLALSSGVMDMGAFSLPGTIEELTSGTIAGIKLYPPIGFSPFPAAPAHREASLLFFKLCENSRIPITVHCQPVQSGSYRPDEIGKEQADQFTDPAHWKHVLAACPDLKINFAHFSGEIMVRNTFFKTSQAYARKPPKQGWCWDLVEMLKAYPHTYADLSAFDFTKDTWRTALGVMLILDDLNRLDEFVSLSPKGQGGYYKLANKLMWGSDFPMTITLWNNNYTSIIDAFKSALDLGPAWQNLKDASQWPEFGNISPSTGAASLDHFVSQNPHRFLLG